MTLQTIADAVGVSRMTVSNAFSRPDQLSSELRERILSTAAELGYAGPDPAARNLVRGRAGTIGVMLTDRLTYAFDEEVTAAFVGAIAAELAPTGSAITLLTSEVDGDFVAARDIALDGAVLYSCYPEAPAVDFLIRRRLPLVFVDQDPHPDYDSVNIDDRDGARQAAQHLVELGHRRVGIATARFGLPDDEPGDPRFQRSPVSRDRFAGWSEPLSAVGADVTVVEVPKHGDQREVSVFAPLFDGDAPPTAILCVSDAVAGGVIHAARERDLDVPHDLSVVGFDGSQLAAVMQPPLTTVRQDVAGKGHAAAAALVRRLAGSSAPPERVVLPVELVVGGTTAPPPG